MGINYCVNTLNRIRETLPRRPHISAVIFNKLHVLGINKQYRGKGLATAAGQRTIPVRITCSIKQPRPCDQLCDVNKNIGNEQGTRSNGINTGNNVIV